MAGYIPINIPQRQPSGPFGPDFFKRKFHQFIREACNATDAKTVLELVLVSGQVLDISHFEEFDNDYMLACVFVDDRNCEDIYHTYIRYDAIFRVNVFDAKKDSRQLGFNLLAYNESQAAKQAAAEPEATDSGRAAKKSDSASKSKRGK